MVVTLNRRGQTLREISQVTNKKGVMQHGSPAGPCYLVVFLSFSLLGKGGELEGGHTDDECFPPVDPLCMSDHTHCVQIPCLYKDRPDPAGSRIKPTMKLKLGHTMSDLLETLALLLLLTFTD